MDLTKLLAKPISQTDPDWRAMAEGGALLAVGLALLVLSNTTLSWERFSHRFWRVSGSLVSTGAIAYATGRIHFHRKLSGYYLQRERDRQQLVRRVDEQMITMLIEGMNQMVAKSTYEPAPFDREKLLSEATGIALLGNSGSGKTTLAQYIAQGINQPILVLDPHANSYGSTDYPWGNLVVVADHTAILDCMDYLLDLLDQGDKRPLTIIADEYPKIRQIAHDQNRTVADRFIVQYGSEARKFNKLAIFCSQSGNTEALGLKGKGDFLVNFALIRLQKVARKYAKNLKGASEIYDWAKTTAYPVLIDDSVACLHPNLGHHKHAKKGAIPTGLLPLDSPPLEHELPGLPSTEPAQCAEPAQSLHKDAQWLETLWHLPCTEPAQNPHTGVDCPKCGSSDVRTNGTYKGEPRYRCKSCGKTWSKKK